MSRQADPSLSGEIDWPSLRTPDDLESALDAGGFDYVIYEDRDWGNDLGAERMRRVIELAVADGTLKPIARFYT